MSGRAGGRFTVGRLMLAIAALAVLLAAGMYRWQNADVDQATISANLWALRRGDAATRRLAAIDLSRIKPTNAVSVEAALAEAVVGDSDPGVREVAVHTLGWVVDQDRKGQPPALPVGPTDAELMPTRALLRALSDPDTRVRRAAVQAITTVREAGLTNPPLALAIEAQLFRLLEDADPEIRAATIQGLAWSNSPSVEARGRAIALIEHDPEVKVRNAAVQALVVGWPAAELYPFLLARHSIAPTEAERGWIIKMLIVNNDQVSPPPESIPPLVELMATDPTAARWVPVALSKLGKGARPWLGAIGRAAERELKTLPVAEWSAVAALVKIDPTSPEAQAVLIPISEHLRDATSEADRYPLTGLLNRYGPAAGLAAPTLREALHSPMAGVRTDAAWLLGGLGPAAGPAVVDLEPLSRQDPDPAVRDLAQRALDKLRESADESVTSQPPTPN